MSPEAINKAIARELCYYVIQPPEEDGTRAFKLCAPAGENWKFDWHETEDEAWADAGEWTSDLNAMHAAEAILAEDQRSLYARKLLVSACFAGHEKEAVIFDCAHATAMERAEAFLRTVGKWEEPK